MHELSWFWIIVPLMGLIVQPIIGHYSDNTLVKIWKKTLFLNRSYFSISWFSFNATSKFFIAFMPALWVGAGMLMIMDASF